MQKNSSEKTAPKGPPKAVKYLLAAFVAASIGLAIYKALPCCSGAGETAEAAVETAVPAQQARAQAAAAPVPAAPAAKPKPVAVKAAPEKTALVYYFYTTARCYSCNLIENYTRETVEQRFAQPYNGWRVEFKGVNVDLPENKHFIQDYWLNSKSVVVQKFEGEKPLKWELLKSVWQLLGSKERYMDYVAGEVRKTLDGK